MELVMSDARLPQTAALDRARGWLTFALMLGAAVGVVLLGAVPLLRLFPIP